MNWKYLSIGLLVTVPLLVLLAVAFQYDPHYIASPLIGKPAPDFSLPVLDSTQEQRLSDLKGSPVVLNFWATWCVPCRQEHANLQAASQKWGKQVQFLGVVYQDEPAKIRDWLNRYGSGYPTLIDVGSKAAIGFGVYGVPETYFIDAAGVIQDKYAGPLSLELINAYVQALLSVK